MAVPYYGDFPEDDTVNLPWNSFDSNDPSNSVTVTDLVDADIFVHKDGSATAITTDGATIDIDAPGVGAHMITIDTSADAAYSTGSEYAVRINGVTIDSGTVNAWVGAFSIERAGGALAIAKLIQTAVITNAAGVDISADIADVPTVAEFNARTLVAASYFDPAADAVANVTLVATTTVSTDAEADIAALNDAPAVSAAANADAVWDEDIEAAHGTDATSGLLLRALGAAISNRSNNATLESLLGVDDDAAADTVIFQVWEEILTGATHNVATSAGRRLRDITADIITAGTAQAGASTSITLASGETSTDGAFDPGVIAITGGTGSGQSRLIFDYDGTTKIATVDRSWRTQPDATSEYVITSDAGRESVNEGIATAGANGSITLNADASAIDDTYKDQTVFIRNGTGEDQCRKITAYNGTTKVATVVPDWETNPSTDSVYVVLPEGLNDATGLSDQSKLDVNAEVDTAISDAALATAANLATVDTNVDDLKLGIIFGAAATGTLSTTQATSDLTGFTDDQLIGRIIIFTAGPADGEATDITDYASASGLLTFTALTLAPEDGDAFKIV